MDVSQYLEIFLDETTEHLQNLNTQILELEQDSENMDTINEIFRAAHSLKGMAGTMGYKRMQTLTHDMENVFSEVRNGNIKVKANMIDILFHCLDALEEYTKNIRGSADEGTNENEPLIRMLNDLLKDTKDKESKPAGQPKTEPEKTEDTDANENKKWLDIKLDSTDVMVINEAQKQGENVIGVTVKVQDTCLLKAARAFLVFKALEEIGEIIISEPSVQDIEDEKFEMDFSLFIITKSSVEKVMAVINNVSEIDTVVADIIDIGKMQLNDESKAAAEHKESMHKDEQNRNSANVPQQVKQDAGQSTSDKKAATKSAAGKPIVNRTVRVDIEKLDVLMNLVSELIIAKNSLVSASQATPYLNENSSQNSVNEQIEYLESVTTNLHESVMKVRMVPIESVVNKFPRMIRDLSKNLDKKMELYMSGEETELDRTVVDEIGDPLMHLLRNAADHGLESAEVRARTGKPEVGSIWLDAYQDGNSVVIEVKDDGNGINTEKVKMKAIERGTISVEQAANMNEKEIIDLLFLPSFSTSENVSDVSGRGVGLDVVKSKIEALSGEVEVRSILGEGSTWIIRLPLTLAIIQALMVVVGGEKYAISLGSIQTIEDISPSDIKLVQNKEVIHLRGSVIPIIRLYNELDVESSKRPEDNIVVIIAKKGDKTAGLVVDELLGQQEIVIKSMGKYIDNKCKLISGATILGDGEVALILDTNALI
ncbi:MAG TPA: chemotaxis protein CheA [Lachnospiraceae bacterium]|nr:chemotaxis protein CheA [Lachnospiraceae bacterium]